ncbi:MAG: GNAT family N-acetyltransferase [Labilithrix sp.]|nr:GNAT family N-acetyltransferase [Labilithrix sp.]MBX3224551.1 GNAT family N-acetyltransferase [Labilithrix sp.]
MPLPAAAARLRRATPADVAAAAAIIGDALAGYGLPFDPDGRDADVKLLGSRPDHDDFVAEQGGRPIGIASVGPHGDAGVAWISKLFVAREARRAGVGRALLEAAHEAARARGYLRVGLRTRVVFREAIALYESEAYTLTSAEPAVLETGDVVYFRALSARPVDNG